MNVCLLVYFVYSYWKYINSCFIYFCKCSDQTICVGRDIVAGPHMKMQVMDCTLLLTAPWQNSL